MTANSGELQRREKAALAAIVKVFGTENDQYGATLFVSHHLDEIEGSYWQKHLGTSMPAPRRVLELLQLRPHWGDDDGSLDALDFTLPDNVTNYVISVRFDDNGQVEEITMES